MMRKTLTLFVACLFLNGCSYIVQKPDIEQGNIVTSDMVAKIHTGMTESQVKDVLGPPILTNIFDTTRLDYVYTMKPGHGDMQEQSMTLIFRNGRLSTISGNMYSAFVR